MVVFGAADDAAGKKEGNADATRVTALFGEMLNQNVDVVFGRSRHPKMQEE